MAEEVSLVDYQYWGAASFGDFGGQCLGGLGDQGGVVETGGAAECRDYCGVNTAGADGRIG